MIYASQDPFECLCESPLWISDPESVPSPEGLKCRVCVRPIATPQRYCSDCYRGYCFEFPRFYVRVVVPGSGEAAVSSQTPLYFSGSDAFYSYPGGGGLCGPFGARDYLGVDADDKARFGGYDYGYSLVILPGWAGVLSYPTNGLYITVTWYWNLITGTENLRFKAVAQYNTVSFSCDDTSYVFNFDSELNPGDLPPPWPASFTATRIENFGACPP
jgi:hypothetical protein